MKTITRLASGASAYSRSHYATSQTFDDHSSFGPDDQELAGQDWSGAIDELLRIRNLSEDWDGEGTEAPHPSLVDGAITLAQTLQAKGMMPPDRVHASVNATVYFEWYTQIGYQEIEVVSPVDAEYRFVRKGSDKTEVFYLSSLS